MNFKIFYLYIPCIHVKITIYLLVDFNKIHVRKNVIPIFSISERKTNELCIYNNDILMSSKTFFFKVDNDIFKCPIKLKTKLDIIGSSETHISTKHDSSFQTIDF